MTRSRTALRLWSVVVAATVVALACSLPFSSAPGPSTGTPSPEVSPLPVASATPGTTTPTTLGPLSSATVEADCTWHAAFVEDVTIPDDTVVEAGSAFVKTWRIRNSGTCAWAAGTTFSPVGGNDLGGPTFVPVPLTAPDGTVDLSATLRAPTSAGTYRSDWQLQTPNGERFGGVFYIQVVIAGQATPTVTPTPEPAAVAPPRPRRRSPSPSRGRIPPPSPPSRRSSTRSTRSRTS